MGIKITELTKVTSSADTDLLVVETSDGTRAITKANADSGLTSQIDELQGEIEDLEASIPTVNNATLTIQKNGTQVGTFTANASTDSIVDITVPTKTSDLTNDSDFVESSSLATVATSGSYNDLINTPTIPTKVSELTNDSGYTTNVGTITGITMNGSSVGVSGVVDLGTVITEHQDISGKQDTIETITFDGTVDSVANNTDVTALSFDVEADKRYLYTCVIRFPSNSTGYRKMYMNTDESTSPRGYMFNSISNAVNGTFTYIQLAIEFAGSADTTWYVRIYQNSGSTLSPVYYRSKLIVF